MGKRKRRKRSVRRLGAFLGAVVAEATGNAVYRGFELLTDRLDKRGRWRGDKDQSTGEPPSPVEHASP